MNSKAVTTTEKTDNGRCYDIYADEIKTSIKTLMRFREAWLRSSSAWNTDLFQYADSDFYFFPVYNRQAREKHRAVYDSSIASCNGTLRDKL